MTACTVELQPRPRYQPFDASSLQALQLLQIRAWLRRHRTDHSTQQRRPKLGIVISGRATGWHASELHDTRQRLPTTRTSAICAFVPCDGDQ